METLDGYLKAVKFWLPSEQKDDIIAELSEDIRSQIEDKESELGRKLSDAEVEAILQKGGPPMLVAQRYLPQRYLIGPALFPIYWFVLRLVWMCLFAPWLIVGIGIEIFAGFSGAHSAAGMWDTFVRSLFINFAAVTGVFALIERYHAETGFLKVGKPRKLPAVRDPNRVPRCSSIGELGWDIILLLWWVNLVRIPAIPGSTEIIAAPIIVRFFYWPILGLLVCQGMIAAFNAIHPQWTRRRASIRGIVNVFGLLVVVPLLAIWLSGGTFVSVSSSSLSPAEIASAQKWITLGWSTTILIWAALGYTARLFQDVRRATGKPPTSNRVVRLLVGE